MVYSYRIAFAVENASALAIHSAAADVTRQRPIPAS